MELFQKGQSFTFLSLFLLSVNPHLPFLDYYSIDFTRKIYSEFSMIGSTQINSIAGINT